MSGNFESTCQELKIAYRISGTHKHAREGWIQIDCPFCGQGSDKYHMGYPIGSHIVFCWKCGRHRLIDSLMLASNTSYSQVKQLIDQWDSVVTYVPEQKKGSFKFPSKTGELRPAHKRYLKQRKFDWRYLQDVWSVQGTSQDSNMSWRIIIPIIQGGVIVSWTARSISDEGVRYLSAKPEHESVNHKDTLYGEDYCRQTVIICEGPFDVWRIGPGAVATYGTSYTDTQLLRLSKYNRRVICFDNERAAQRAAHTLCHELSQFRGETINVQLDASDPDAANANEIKQLRRRFLV